MSVVGMVTGSKDLMKLGAVMGVVGGIGGAIAGGATAAAGEAAAADMAGAEAGASNALSDAGYAGTEFAELPATTTPITQAALQGQPLAPAADGIVTQATPAGPAAQPTSLPNVEQQAATSPYETGPRAPDAPAGIVGAQAPVTPADNPTDQRLATNQQRTPGNPDISSGNLFSGFLDFAKNNKEVLNSGVQLAGGALKGANDRDMWDQRIQLARDQFNRANSVGTFAPRTNGIVAGAAA